MSKTKMTVYLVIDLGKANNYAWRLVTGDWRADGGR